MVSYPDFIVTPPGTHEFAYGTSDTVPLNGLNVADQAQVTVYVELGDASTLGLSFDSGAL